MLSFVVDELVWAMVREREEEARSTRPHTERPSEVERLQRPRGDWGHWISLALRGGAPKARSCR